MSQAGLFITFEGGEGSGKTTQINRLAQRLTQKGRKVITTREPGGTPEGDSIRDLLVQRQGGEWTPLSEVLLLLAARVMHVEKIIRPALANGKIVISDRFSDSTLAYQGYGHQFDLKLIKKLSALSIKKFKPDLTFIMDIDPKTGLKRSGRRLAAEALDIDQTEDRFENLDLEFHQRLRKGFLEIARKDKKRCYVINADQKIDTITDQIEEIVEGRL